ncbi:MAG: hypothetical protein JWN72_2338 [Thermoleophilia bacterium]|nr:hypothetical protein [Thermoleophilia bacterium]
MQIDPKVAAAAASATQAAPVTSVTSPGAHAAKDGTVVVNTPTGGELELLPGRQVVARVVEVGDTNAAKISLAGQTLSVQTDARLRVGDTVQLSIERADSAQVRLAIVPPQGASGSGSGGGAGSGLPQGSGSAAQAVIGELAKAGVPVTPELAKAITAIANQLTGGAAPTAGTSSPVVRTPRPRSPRSTQGSPTRRRSAPVVARSPRARLRVRSRLSPGATSPSPPPPPDAWPPRSTWSARSVPPSRRSPRVRAPWRVHCPRARRAPSHSARC